LCFNAAVMTLIQGPIHTSTTTIRGKHDSKDNDTSRKTWQWEQHAMGCYHGSFYRPKRRTEKLWPLSMTSTWGLFRGRCHQHLNQAITSIELNFILAWITPLLCTESQASSFCRTTSQTNNLYHWCCYSYYTSARPDGKQPFTVKKLYQDVLLWFKLNKYSV
jgi:hypothetical protein